MTPAETWIARATIHRPPGADAETRAALKRGVERGDEIIVVPGQDAVNVWQAGPLTQEERELRLIALGLKRMVFRDLRDGLEGRPPREATLLEELVFPTWDKPFVYVQMNYPLSDNASFAPPPEIEDQAQALWWIAAKLNEEQGSKNRVLTALQTLTRLAAFVRRNGEVNPVVPLAFFDSYQGMTEEERQQFLRVWFSPISHGDAYDEDEQGRATPGKDASLEVQAEGRNFRAAVVFEVYPLMLDLDAGIAFYTLKVGLPWSGDMGSPVIWTATEREALWTALFQSFEKLDAFYRGAAETVPDKVEVSLEAIVRALAASALPDRLARTKAEEAAHQEVTLAGVTERLVPPAEAERSISASTSLVLHSIDHGGGRKIFPLAFGPALADAGAVAFVQQSHHLKLPRSWAKVRKLEDLKRERIAAILDSPTAPDAFTDFRAKTGNPLLWPKLRKVHSPGQRTPTTDLSPESMRKIRSR